MQQEGSRKLNLGAKRTMQIAQGLYEGVSLGGETVGLITYMRTDGVQMAAEATESLPPPDRARLRQELHARTAARLQKAAPPTPRKRTKRSVRRSFPPARGRRRPSRSRPVEALYPDLEAHDGKPDGGRGAGPGRRRHRRRGRPRDLARDRLDRRFRRFLPYYHEDRDDPETNGDDDSERRLPALNQDDALGLGPVAAEQHFTQPPPRYTEASLVKKLEELGIGRPSTYASILSVLQDRDYVRLDKKRFIPEDRGRLVTAFLSSFFEHYVEYGFTAGLEEKLDDISGGRVEWKTVLREFWNEFSKAVESIRELRVSQVLDTLDEMLGPHFFPPRDDGKDPRACPACANGRLNLKLGRFGAFIGCSNYPECRHTQPLAVQNGDGSGDAAHAAVALGPKLLGGDPATGQPVTLRKPLRVLRPTRRRGALSEKRPRARARKTRSRPRPSPSANPFRKARAGPGRSQARPRAVEPAARGLPSPRNQRAGVGVHRPLRSLHPAPRPLCLAEGR